MTESDSVQHVSDATFQSTVLDSDTPVLVDFWAPWCGPCRMLHPVIESLASDYRGRLAVAKVNVDENPGTSQRYQVMGIPTLILFKSGQPAERFVGYMPKEDLQRRLDSIL